MIEITAEIRALIDKAAAGMLLLVIKSPTHTM